MAKKRSSSSDSLKLAKQYRDLLLYTVTGGNMGTKPEIAIGNLDITFSEKKALLSEMIKIAEIERRNAETEEDVSGFDLIKKDLASGRAKNKRGGDDSWAKLAAGLNKSIADASGSGDSEAEADHDAGTSGSGV
jgi:hypothetical protein